MGQTLYFYDCGNILSFAFRDDGKILVLEGDEEYWMDYSIEDDVLYTIGEESEAHTLLSYDSELVKIFESDGEVTTLYFNRSDAEASARSDLFWYVDHVNFQELLCCNRPSVRSIHSRSCL